MPITACIVPRARLHQHQTIWSTRLMLICSGYHVCSHRSNLQIVQAATVRSLISCMPSLAVPTGQAQQPAHARCSFHKAVQDHGCFIDCVSEGLSAFCCWPLRWDRRRRRCRHFCRHWCRCGYRHGYPSAPCNTVHSLMSLLRIEGCNTATSTWY